MIGSPVTMLEPSRELATQGTGVSSTPFIAALAGAGWLHLLLILAVSFVWPEPGPPPESAMEVILLKDIGAGAPNRASEAALAQRDQVGESPRGDAAIPTFGDAPEETSDTRAETDGPATESVHPAEPPERADESTPTEAPPHDDPLARPDAMTLPLREPPTAPVLATEAEAPPRPEVDPLTPRQTVVDAAQILSSQGPEVARLTSSRTAGTANGAKRARRKSISASTREFRYASYLAAWAQKVERIGNLNYPQAARDQRLYGSLILHVAVRADGSLENIRVVRSSGFELLDEAAIRIVELAAPFSPFPPDIAAETDVLDIVRTWQFMRGDVLGWER
ncbi:energy transducer TonB [Allochromatium tepidum]|uniref:Cell envelope biogenesis protein TonB n=1 Tax=Allochromatium tepidum TaxID=553982 RepID=A0ABM7QI32_9GAMM|nr:energy transducer TonB [Allochromatium tepidum]BCU05410.1 cell envelope biogenesis protein TonB [Allochromatium tepidum]